jgi:hypothetical protein
MGAPFPPRSPWIPSNFSGVLGPRPGAPTQAYPLVHAPTPPIVSQPASAPSWDYTTLYQTTPSYGVVFPPPGQNCIIESGATTHVTGNQGTLTSSHSPLGINSHHIIVGNGSCLPLVATGTTHLTSRPFVLSDVLVSPSTIQNLCATRKFVHDNNFSV